MPNPLASITPAQIIRFAKVLAMITAMLMTAGYVTDRLTVETAGIAALCLALSLLLAVPDQRSSELLGAAAIWMTTAEFMATSKSGHFDLWRWAVAVAALALVVVPLKVQYLRTLARTNPHRPIGELDRRAWSTGAFPQTGAQLAAMRGEASELEASEAMPGHG